MSKKKKKKQSKHKESYLNLTSKWLIWFGLFLVLLTPLKVNLYLFYPYNSYKGLWFMGSVQFLFAVWLFLAFHDSNYRPKFNIILNLFILFLISATLSMLFGADPAASFWSNHGRMLGILMHVHLFALFLVCSSFFKTPEEWHKVFTIALVIAVPVSIWGIAAYYNIHWILGIFDIFQIVPVGAAELSQGGSTFGQTSFMGTYLLINLFIALYLIVHTANKPRIIYGLFFFIVFAGLMLNPGGRAMRGAFFIGLILMGLIYFIFNSKQKYLRMGAVGALVSSFLLSFYLVFSTFQEESFVRAKIMSLRGMPGRLVNWESAWQAIKERPLLGWGFENFDIALYKYYDPRVMLNVDGYVGEAWHDRAHNIIIDSLIANGFLGTALLFSLFISGCIVIWHYYLKENRIGFWEPTIITTLFFAHFIQNLTVFDMIGSYMLLFIVLAYAASLSAEKGKENTAKIREDVKRPAIYSLIIILVIAVSFYASFYHFVYKPYKASLYTAQAIDETRAENLTGIYSQAINTSPLGRQQIRKRLAQQVILLLNDQETEQLRAYIEIVEYMTEELRKNTEVSPQHFRYFFLLARLYFQHKQILLLDMDHDDDKLEHVLQIASEAEKAFEKSIELSPNNVQAYWGLAQTLMEQGYLLNDFDKYEKALVLTEKAVEIEPRFYNSHLLGIFAAAKLLNDQQLAAEKITFAISIDPSWETLLNQYLVD